MASETFERVTAATVTATTELVAASGANVYFGGKAQENALPASISIALAASATTDGMEATITVLDAAGVRIPRSFMLDVYISESEAGDGLTADDYSGDVTAVTGTILEATTAKKKFHVKTAASGIAVILAVDSANPADQYVAAALPNGRVFVSAVSGTNWEGAA